LDAAVAHWRLSGIVTADSGVPFYFISTDNENIRICRLRLAALTEFPISLRSCRQFPQTASAWFNTACYQLPAFGSGGSAGRHAVYSQGLLNWDASATKQWPVTENTSVQFRAEFFNASNGATFDPPGIFFGSPAFGRVTNTTRQQGRQIQFALKFHF
jgi:hypothetical protein